MICLCGEHKTPNHVCHPYECQVVYYSDDNDGFYIDDIIDEHQKPRIVHLGLVGLPQKAAEKFVRKHLDTEGIIEWGDGRVFVRVKSSLGSWIVAVEVEYTVRIESYKLMNDEPKIWAKR